LGDIINCFPAPAPVHERERGRFLLLPQYHSMFRAVSYCQPVGLEVLKRKNDYHRVYDSKSRAAVTMRSARPN